MSSAPSRPPGSRLAVPPVDRRCPLSVVDDYLRAHLVDRESSLHSATTLVDVFGGVYAFGVMGLFRGPVVVGLFKTLATVLDERYVEA